MKTKLTPGSLTSFQDFYQTYTVGQELNIGDWKWKVIEQEGSIVKCVIVSKI